MTDKPNVEALLDEPIATVTSKEFKKGWKAAKKHAQHKIDSQQEQIREQAEQLREARLQILGLKEIAKTESTLLYVDLDYHKVVFAKSLERRDKIIELETKIREQAEQLRASEDALREAMEVVIAVTGFEMLDNTLVGVQAKKLLTKAKE